MGCFVLLKIDKNIGNLCAIFHSENPEAVFLIGSQNHINKSMKCPKNDEKILTHKHGICNYVQSQPNAPLTD